MISLKVAIVCCFAFVSLLIVGLQVTRANLTVDQQLIVACHRVDFDAVKAALKEGANVNATFGQGDTASLFVDKWTLGSPVAASKWTPLLAVANSDRYPPPTREILNTEVELRITRSEQMKTSEEVLQTRAKDAVEIAKLLIDRKANINADDGWGATALYNAIYSRKLEMAKLLIQSGANVNTKTGVYIDGPGDITPLHRAVWSEELVRLLLEKGADRNAKDSTGKTPADWLESEKRANLRLLKLHDAPFKLATPGILSEPAISQ